MSIDMQSASDLSLEGETLANDYHWRSTKAKKQLRDRFGRWISLGANVRFRGDGNEQSGVVTSVVDGRAYVDQKNRDGSVTQKIIDPSAIRVIASKATIPSGGNKLFDAGNNFSKSLKTPEFQDALAENGAAAIERADGYALSAEHEDAAMGNENKVLDGSEGNEADSKGNPVIYQLYAPGGRSLGKYSEAAEGDFDDMVEADQAAKAPAAETSPAPVAASLFSSEEDRPFRVPEAVKTEILKTLENFSAEMPEADLAIAGRLARESSVSLSDVQWVHGFFCDNEAYEGLRGGYKGRKWAAKIVEPVDDTPEIDPKYSFDDDTFGYFALGTLPGSTLVSKLIAVDYESGHVYAWTPDGFAVIPEMEITDVDEPQIIPVDEMTADSLAHWIDTNSGEDFDVLDSDPEERNLFTGADSEIDYDELDRVYAIIAAAGDGVYTPVERSQNAKVQRRGSGGKFGPAPAEPTAVIPEQDAPTVQKATLPVELPIVVDPAARIAEWLSTAAEAPVVAAGEPSGTPEYTEEDQAVEDAATGPTDEALYFAIVDEVDKTAVLDAIAIVKSNGAPSAFVRTDGAWVASPDTMVLLQGATPPTVAELPDPATVKTVLEQIDAHDSGADTTSDPTAEELPQEGEVPIAASGYAMSDGSLPIFSDEDITQAVTASGGSADIFTKAYIRKRARALNRMDLVPEEWREFSLAEIGELSAAQTVYGDFGEIIVASGIPGIADTPADFKNVAKLKNYWKHGKGSLKIRWNTPGDLTRAHKHLARYVGPQRAWGLAQQMHQELFGVSNYTHDVATGQHKAKRRKR